MNSFFQYFAIYYSWILNHVWEGVTHTPVKKEATHFFWYFMVIDALGSMWNPPLRFLAFPRGLTGCPHVSKHAVAPL